MISLLKNIICVMCTIFITQSLEIFPMVEPFSYEEIHEIPAFSLKQPLFLQASDGSQLAYYPFLPSNEPKNVVIFYHGGGAYTNAPYQLIGKQLAEQYNLGAYMFDIRGHGKSAGARGDAPTIEQVFTDITTAVDFVHQQHPHANIYLSGHSSGAGLVLNYGANNPSPLVTGYICLAPYLGPNSGANKEHTSPETSFVKKVRTWVYILGGISGGRLCAHTPAVYFNYSPEILADPLMVGYYTFTMSCATSPYDTNAVFAKLDKPVIMFIGDQDEQFVAEKVMAYADANPKNLVTGQIVPGAKHLSILLQSSDLIAQAIKAEG